MPSIPALFETAVKECKDCDPLSLIAFIIVSATPQRPKPALRIVEPDWRSATAVSAESNSFFDRSILGALLYARRCLLDRANWL